MLSYFAPQVTPSKIFERDGSDVHSTISVNFAQVWSERIFNLSVYNSKNISLSEKEMYIAFALL